MNHFRDAQARGVAGGQDRAVLDALHAGEELLDLLGTEDDRQRLLLLGKREDVLDDPVPFEGRICSSPNSAGDLPKWRAKQETCWR